MTDAVTTCRACGSIVGRTFVDLGAMPLANSYVAVDAAENEDTAFPLHVQICDKCLLVQLPEVVPAAEIFDDYAYFSSVSASWVDHARRFVDSAVTCFRLSSESHVLELASNDGYLLRHFVDRGIPVLGVEPAANVAAAARADGVPTIAEFFGVGLAERLAAERRADLVVANNVLAHVPDLHDFVAGIALALADDGVVSIEFPHVQRLIEQNQFDTIYHEHFSYFSLRVVVEVLSCHDLRVFDVERLPTHGGSLRVFACRVAATHAEHCRVAAVLDDERCAGLHEIDGYLGYAARVDRVRADTAEFLQKARAEGAVVAAYGAAAKGNTFLNACGITHADVPFVVDRSEHKQGLALPGSRIPILPPSAVDEARPAYLLLLPWNLRAEITSQMAHVRDWGGRFVVAIPELEILP